MFEKKTRVLGVSDYFFKISLILILSLARVCLKVKVSLISKIVCYQFCSLHSSFHNNLSQISEINSNFFAYFFSSVLFPRKLLQSFDLFISSLDSCFVMKDICYTLSILNFLKSMLIQHLKIYVTKPLNPSSLRIPLFKFILVNTP